MIDWLNMARQAMTLSDTYLELAHDNMSTQYFPEYIRKSIYYTKIVSYCFYRDDIVKGNFNSKHKPA